MSEVWLSTVTSLSSELDTIIDQRSIYQEASNCTALPLVQCNGSTLGLQALICRLGLQALVCRPSSASLAFRPSSAGPHLQAWPSGPRLQAGLGADSAAAPISEGHCVSQIHKYAKYAECQSVERKSLPVCPGYLHHAVTRQVGRWQAGTHATM